ncbi:alpha-crystallin A chain [Anabrus simplex]|uniref:alpha-crystallin A chain n=1 Tax=Anabrus simplex TaxID=316456 RepID=UPI0034DD99B0
MSLIFLSDLLDDAARTRARPSSLFDQNFGLGLLNDDLLQTHANLVPLLSGYYRPWRHQASRSSGTSNIQNTQDGFKVNLDVQQFKPDEISVKMVGNSVVVEGKHDERQDEHGFISRQFQRRYVLPEDVDAENVVSKLSSDGILSIQAPKKSLKPVAANERVIQIQHTNAPAVAHTQGSPKGDAKDGSEKMDQ